ncbi:MAG: YobA family protein [Candidatus Gastranaerophilales bacterium]|nr:YobA family protein [Candidatus Gastranaerophilales bacterium]
MKKGIISLGILLCTLLLGGCGQKAETPEEGVSYDGSIGSTAEGDEHSAAVPSSEQTPSTQMEPEEEQILTLRIVDGAEDGVLLLSGESAYSVYRVSLRADAAVSGPLIYLDGQPADVSDLSDGMMVEIAFSGDVMESYPAQIGQIISVSAYSLGTQQNPGGGYYDLCGLYLQVLDDLWEADAGLNNGVDYVSLDLSEAPGNLTEGEKCAVAWRFAELHQVECLMYSYEELLQEGYLTAPDPENMPNLYQWEDGLLFSITAGEETEENYSLPVLRFNAEKWRAPLGAYYFYDCTAVWPEFGSWSGYEVGAEMIS